MAHSYSYSKHGSTARDMQGVPVRTVSAQLGLLDYVPLWEAPRLGGGGGPSLDTVAYPGKHDVLMGSTRPGPNLAWPLTRFVLALKTFP